jgi:hypothetical protein
MGAQPQTTIMELSDENNSARKPGGFSADQAEILSNVVDQWFLSASSRLQKRMNAYPFPAKTGSRCPFGNLTPA